MSLPAFSTQGSLFSIASLSSGLFGQSDRYRLFAQLVYPCLVKARSRLESCYCPDNGRVAIEPVLLLGVSILQYLEGLPDRLALDMLRYHAGWNFALNRQIGDELFHPTTLVNFRQRLINQELSPLAFQSVLEGLVEAGLVPKPSRQRLDSMQIFGCVSRMSRLDCVHETLRLGLQELESQVEESGRPAFWGELWDRYVQSKADFQAHSSVLRTKMNLAGQDAVRLLAWIKQTQLQAGAQVQLLERVWNENFELDATGQRQQRDAQPAGAVQNPHDPEAQWASKGHGKFKKEHVGYKLQVAEVVQEDKAVDKGEPTPNFITAMLTQPAIAGDQAGLPEVEQQQASMGMEKPKTWHVDAGYVSAERLAQAEAQGREIIGPAQPGPQRDGRYSVEDFQIDIDRRTATCPAGKENTQCSHCQDQDGKPILYRFEFGSHCHDCALRRKCVSKGQKHRAITVGPFHNHLQRRRQEQKT